MPTVRVGILGGGYSGLSAALSLRERLAPSECFITLIDEDEVFHPTLRATEALFSTRALREWGGISYVKIFDGMNIRFSRDVVEEIDLDKGKVSGQKGDYIFDLIIVALGSRKRFKPPIFSPKTAKEMRDLGMHLKRVLSMAKNQGWRGAVAESLSTAVVITETLFGVEVAFLIADFMRELAGSEGRYRVFTFLKSADIVPESELGTLVKIGKRQGVEVILHPEKIKVTPRGVKASHGGFGEILAGTIVIFKDESPGLESLVASREDKIIKDGRVVVSPDDGFRSPRYPNVFAIGDSASVPKFFRFPLVSIREGTYVADFITSGIRRVPRKFGKFPAFPILLKTDRISAIPLGKRTLMTGIQRMAFRARESEERIITKVLEAAKAKK